MFIHHSRANLWRLSHKRLKDASRNAVWRYVFASNGPVLPGYLEPTRAFLPFPTLLHKKELAQTDDVAIAADHTFVAALGQAGKPAVPNASKDRGAAAYPDDAAERAHFGDNRALQGTFLLRPRMLPAMQNQDEAGQ